MHQNLVSRLLFHLIRSTVLRPKGSEASGARMGGAKRGPRCQLVHRRSINGLVILCKRGNATGECFNFPLDTLQHRKAVFFFRPDCDTMTLDQTRAQVQMHLKHITGVRVAHANCTPAGSSGESWRRRIE